MNLKETQKALKELRLKIQHAEVGIDAMKQQEKELIGHLKTLQASEQPLYKATAEWCRITNALIAKYKPMSETNPVQAYEELNQIKGSLLTGGYLTEQELKEAL